VYSMAIKTRHRSLTKNITYAPNESKIVELPQDNLVRRLLLKYTIVVKTATGDTVGTAAKQEDFLNLMKRIRVRLNGADSIFDVDLRTYWHALTYEYQKAPEKDTFAIPAAGSDNTYHMTIPIDFAFIRNQVSDFSALVPANLLDSFELIIDWGDAGDVLGTPNDTVFTGTKVDLEMVEVYETTSSRDAINAIVSNLTKIYEGVEQTVIDKEYDSFPANELPIDIRPVPARHLSHLIVAYKNITDGNPDEADDRITNVKLENVQGGGENIFLGEWRFLRKQNQVDFQESHAGVLYIDWADLRNGGLDNINVDALKYKLLTAAPTSGDEDAARIYKKYVPLAV